MVFIRALRLYHNSSVLGEGGWATIREMGTRRLGAKYRE